LDCFFASCACPSSSISWSTFGWNLCYSRFSVVSDAFLVAHCHFHLCRKSIRLFFSIFRVSPCQTSSAIVSWLGQHVNKSCLLVYDMFWWFSGPQHSIRYVNEFSKICVEFENFASSCCHDILAVRGDTELLMLDLNWICFFLSDC
jgi:hypothetical protein